MNIFGIFRPGPKEPKPESVKTTRADTLRRWAVKQILERVENEINTAAFKGHFEAWVDVPERAVNEVRAWCESHGLTIQKASKGGPSSYFVTW